MPEENWEVVDEVAGDLQAEMLRGLLEAQGFRVWLSQEGAGKAYGLTLSTLGAVQILVPSDSAQGARHVLDDYYAGLYEKDEFKPEEPDEKPNDGKRENSLRSENPNEGPIDQG